MAAQQAAGLEVLEHKVHGLSGQREHGAELFLVELQRTPALTFCQLAVCRGQREQAPGHTRRGGQQGQFLDAGEQGAQLFHGQCAP